MGVRCWFAQRLLRWHNHPSHVGTEVTRWVRGVHVEAWADSLKRLTKAHVNDVVATVDFDELPVGGVVYWADDVNVVRTTRVVSMQVEPRRDRLDEEHAITLWVKDELSSRVRLVR